MPTKMGIQIASIIWLVSMSSATGLLFGLPKWLGYSEHLPEEDMNAYQLIRSKGYPVEKREVVTDDGYRLGVFRIPPKNSSNAPVVFLQHGLQMSCTCWLDNGKNESFAYMLADAGYDVWLGNFRGSTYSKLHTTLDKDSTQYWDFSWDEMAEYDLKAMIDYALMASGKEDLYYVGHSEGTLTAFTKFSDDKEFGKKIRHFFALAPVYYLNHCRGLVWLLGQKTGFFQWIVVSIGYKEFLAQDWINKILSKLLCDQSLINPICSNLLFMTLGPDSSGLNRTRIPVYLAHTPAGTSTRNMVHFGQMVQNRHCQKYDFGSAKDNVKHYGKPSPPLYHVEDMEVPVSLYWGDVDWLADPADVAQLTTKLNSLKENVWVRGANHADFVWGLQAPENIYKPIMKTIKKDEEARKA